MPGAMGHADAISNELQMRNPELAAVADVVLEERATGGWRLAVVAHDLDSCQKLPLCDIEPLRSLTLTEFRAPHCDLADLSALRDQPLEILDVFGNRRVQLPELSKQTLVELSIAATPIRSLETLGKQPLRVLHAEFSRLEVIRSSEVAHLEEIHLCQCQLDDWRFLQDCSALTGLYLPECNITDSAMQYARLPRLINLVLSRTAVTDYSWVRQMSLLSCFNAAFNRIEDLIPVIGHPEVGLINIADSQVMPRDYLSLLKKAGYVEKHSPGFWFREAKG